MASVAYQAYQKGSFTLFPKKPLRDFIYIKDVVNANLAAFKLDRGVFDVGYGEPMLFEDLVSGMGIKYDYTTEDKIPSWYQYYTCANKNIRIPGWKPKYNVESGTKLCKEFKFSKEKLVDIMEGFGGTTEDLYFHVADLVGINVDTFNKLKKYARNL